jgi:hypothetical protein
MKTKGEMKRSWNGAVKHVPTGTTLGVTMPKAPYAISHWASWLSEFGQGPRALAREDGTLLPYISYPNVKSPFFCCHRTRRPEMPDLHKISQASNASATLTAPMHNIQILHPTWCFIIVLIADYSDKVPGEPVLTHHGSRGTRIWLQRLRSGIQLMRWVEGCGMS